MTAQAAVSTLPTRDALDIPPLTHDESRMLAHTEVQRFVDLLMLLDDLQATGVAFVSLSEGIDATTPAGRLQLLQARERALADLRARHRVRQGPAPGPGPGS